MTRNNTTIFFSFSFGVIFFAVLLLVRIYPIMSWEVSFFLIINNWRVSPINQLTILITTLGSQLVVFSFSLGLLLFFTIFKNWYNSIILVAVILGQELLTVGVKYLVQRPRPYLIEQLISADGYSFPSGHAVTSVAFYGLMIFFLTNSFLEKQKKIAIYSFWGILIFLIGFSRVYLAVHWPSDVLGGFFLGLGWLFLVLGLAKIISANKKNMLK